MKQILFGGSASPKLAGEIARRNGLELGKLETVTFTNSEIKVTVQSAVENREVVLVQATSNPTNNNLVELLLAVDALRRQSASFITAVIPYFGYARQNMQHRPGECVSMNVVAKVLESLGVDKVITVDLHDEGSSSVFSIAFENRSALPLLAKKIYQELDLDENKEKDYLIGTPDQGGIERARLFADNFYRNPKAFDTIAVEKKRDLDKLHESMAVEVMGQVRNKHLILVDDVSTSGKTIVNAAGLCLEQGAREVSAVVVHPDFGLGVPGYIQASNLSRFYTTNTIENPLENLGNYGKIRVVDVADIFANL